LRTLHVHLDESGDLEFSPDGSPFFFFSVVWTYEPAPLAQELNGLRFALIKEGHGEKLSGFHAKDDAQPRRDRVFPVLTKHTNWMFASLVVNKRRVNPSIREPENFYPKFATMLLRFVFRGRLKPQTHKVLIYTDTLPFSGKRREAAEIAIKAACRADLPAEIPFHVLHHRRESNAWIQVADYCCWSVCRKWQLGNLDAYNLLRPRLAATEIDPTSRGDGTIYY